MRNLVAVWLYLGMLFVCHPSFGQQTAPLPGDQGDLVFGRTEIAQVEFSGHQFSIVPETQNYIGETPNFPRRWRFSVDPVFKPSFEADGSVKLIVQKDFNLSKKIIGGGTATDYSSTTRIGIPLTLSDPAILAAAATQVTHHFEDMKYTFSPEQIGRIPVRSIEVAMPDLKNTPCVLDNPEIPVSTTAPIIIIWVDCTITERQALKESEKDKIIETFKNRLPSSNVTLTVNYRAKSAEIGGVNVATKSIKDTKLYGELKGDQSQTMLITRHDLRDLSMTSAEQIYAEYRGVRSSRCTSDFVSDVLDHFKNEEKIQSGQFSAEMLKTTYNPKDIDPDEVTKTFDKNIRSDSTENQVNFSTGGGVSFMGLGANGSMSGGDFTKHAAAADIEAEWNGKKWVAKSVDVLQVNISQFATSYRASCSDYSVGPEDAYPSNPVQLLLKPEYWELKTAENAQTPGSK